MPIIFEPPKPHVCNPPPRGCHEVETPDGTLPSVIVSYPIGTQWLCEECERVHELCRDDITGHRIWVKLNKWTSKKLVRKYWSVAQ